MSVRHGVQLCYNAIRKSRICISYKRLRRLDEPFQTACPPPKKKKAGSWNRLESGGIRKHNGHRNLWFRLAANFLAGACLRQVVTLFPCLVPWGALCSYPLWSHGVSAAFYAGDHLRLDSRLNSRSKGMVITDFPRNNLEKIKSCDFSGDRQYSNTLCMLKKISSFFRPPKLFPRLHTAQSWVLESSCLGWDRRGRKICLRKVNFK